MTHPEDLLAPYVDGSATGEERAAVEAHLSACARCRAEVAQASSARTALRSLPMAEAPAGLAPETASGASGNGAGGAPAWYRWGGIATAAAAIVLLLTLVLPRIGGGGSQKAENAAAASGTAVPREAVSPVPIEIQRTDFGGQALSALAKGAAQPAQPVASGTDSGGGIFDGNVGVEGSGRQGSARQAERARACLTTAFVDVPGRLVRLIAAPFDGTPAYIGLYQQSSVANQPADTVVARAAAVQGCTPLSIAQARFG